MFEAQRYRLLIPIDLGKLHLREEIPKENTRFLQGSLLLHIQAEPLRREDPKLLYRLHSLDSRSLSPRHCSQLGCRGIDPKSPRICFN